MKSYIAAGEEYAVIAQDLYRKGPEASLSAAVEVTFASPIEAAGKHSKVTRKKSDGQKMGKRSIQCKNCGKSCHFAKTCPDRKPEEQPAQQQGERPSGKFVGTIDELKQRVREIRAEHEGITSLRVAQMLGVRIETLNKVWEAAPDGEGEDYGTEF
jgi:hypothetical protein